MGEHPAIPNQWKNLIELLIQTLGGIQPVAVIAAIEVAVLGFDQLRIGLIKPGKRNIAPRLDCLKQDLSLVPPKIGKRQEWFV